VPRIFTGKICSLVEVPVHAIVLGKIGSIN